MIIMINNNIPVGWLSTIEPYRSSVYAHTHIYLLYQLNVDYIAVKSSTMVIFIEERCFQDLFKNKKKSIMIHHVKLIFCSMC